MKRTIPTLLVLTILSTSALFAIGPDGGLEPPPTRDPMTEQLAMFKNLPSEHAGVLVTNGRLLFTLERPDSLVGRDSWAWAKANQWGRAWIYTDVDRSTGATPTGATDSDEECASETAEMCDAAGHGPGSTNAERTQHLEEDGGGCTCGADCGDGSGTQAFVTSNSACG